MAMTPPGAGLAKPAQLQSLQAALKGTGLPNNANTPDERLDPQNRMLVDMQRIRKALDRAIEPYDGGPLPASIDIFKMMHGVVSRILAGVDPMSAFLVGVQTIIPSPMPAGTTPGIAAPQASAGPPPPPPSLLQGMQGPVPVTPGGGPPGAPPAPPG